MESYIALDEIIPSKCNIKIIIFVYKIGLILEFYMVQPTIFILF